MATTVVRELIAKLIFDADKALDSMQKFENGVKKLKSELANVSGGALTKFGTKIKSTQTQTDKLGKGINKVNKDIYVLEKSFKRGGVSSTQMGSKVENLKKKLDSLQYDLKQSIQNAPRSLLGTGTYMKTYREIKALEKELNHLGHMKESPKITIHDVNKRLGGLRRLSLGDMASNIFSLPNLIAAGAIGGTVKSVASAEMTAQQNQFLYESALQGNKKQANKELSYATKLAWINGVDYKSTIQGYGDFMAASIGTGFKLPQLRKMYTQFNDVVAARHMSTEHAKYAMIAINEMMSGDKVTTRHLRLQLSQHIPGAVAMMAQAVGVSVQKLEEMLKGGEVSWSKYGEKFMQILHDKFTAPLEEYRHGLQATMSRINQLGYSLSVVASRSGLLKVMMFGLNGILNMLQDPHTMANLQAFSSTLAKAAANPELQKGFHRLGQEFTKFMDFLGSKTFAKAVNNFATFIGKILQHFGWIKAAIMVLIGLKIGATVLGWVGAFAKLLEVLRAIKTLGLGAGIAQLIVNGAGGVTAVAGGAAVAEGGAAVAGGVALTGAAAMVPVVVSILGSVAVGAAIAGLVYLIVKHFTLDKANEKNRVATDELHRTMAWQKALNNIDPKLRKKFTQGGKSTAYADKFMEISNKYHIHPEFHMTIQANPNNDPVKATANAITRYLMQSNEMQRQIAKKNTDSAYTQYNHGSWK